MKPRKTDILCYFVFRVLIAPSSFSQTPPGSEEIMLERRSIELANEICP